MALPYLDNPATLDEMTVMELDGLVAKLNAFLSVEHNNQGGHTAITADSVIVDGPVTVRDEDLTPSSFVRNRALGTRIDIKNNPKHAAPSFLLRLGLAPGVSEQVQFGTFVSGGTGNFLGVRIAPVGMDEWRTLVGALTSGDAWMLVNGTQNTRPLIVVRNPGTGEYRIRPDTLTPVHLGEAPLGRRFTSGYIDDVHSANTFERGRTVSAGDWQAVPYAAGNFTAAGGTWTVAAGNVVTQRFTLVGQTLVYNLILNSTNVGGTAADLQVALPTGYIVTADFGTTFIYVDAGGALTVGYASGVVGTSVVHFRTITLVNWTPTAANNTSLNALLAFEVTG